MKIAFFNSKGGTGVTTNVSHFLKECGGGMAVVSNQDDFPHHQPLQLVIPLGNWETLPLKGMALVFDLSGLSRRSEDFHSALEASDYIVWISNGARYNKIDDDLKEKYRQKIVSFDQAVKIMQAFKKTKN